MLKSLHSRDSAPSLETELHNFLVHSCSEQPNGTSLRIAIQSIIRTPNLGDIEDTISQFDNLSAPAHATAKGCLSILLKHDHIAFQALPHTSYVASGITSTSKTLTKL